MAVAVALPELSCALQRARFARPAGSAGAVLHTQSSSVRIFRPTATTAGYAGLPVRPERFAGAGAVGVRPAPSNAPTPAWRLKLTRTTVELAALLCLKVLSVATVKFLTRVVRGSTHVRKGSRDARTTHWTDSAVVVSRLAHRTTAPVIAIHVKNLKPASVPVRPRSALADRPLT